MRAFVLFIVQALKFQEEYEKALQYFDKVLQYDPQWKEVEQIQNNLLRYLSDIQDSINSRGRVKNRKLQTLISVKFIFTFREK